MIPLSMETYDTSEFKNIFEKIAGSLALRDAEFGKYVVETVMPFILRSSLKRNNLNLMMMSLCTKEQAANAFSLAQYLIRFKDQMPIPPRSISERECISLAHIIVGKIFTFNPVLAMDLVESILLKGYYINPKSELGGHVAKQVRVIRRHHKNVQLFERGL